MIKNLRKWLKDNNMKEVNIELGMFDYNINFLVGDINNLEEYARFKFDYEQFEIKGLLNVYGWHLFCEGYSAIVWIPRYPRTPKDYGTLSHETVHAMVRMMDWAHIKVTTDTDEVLAHGVSYLIRNFLKTRNDKNPQISIELTSKKK